MTDYDTWFRHLTGGPSPPHGWQRELAAATDPADRLIRIPTGFGKTLGALGAWAYHRLHRRDDSWPRRLVWCLPMRVLVEQTAAVAHAALARLGAEGQGVGVHMLMGGSDADEWHLYPE